MPTEIAIPTEDITKLYKEIELARKEALEKQRTLRELKDVDKYVFNAYHISELYGAFMVVAKILGGFTDDNRWQKFLKGEEVNVKAENSTNNNP